MAKVQFPDGTTVQAVGIYERRSEHPDRDHGLSTLTRCGSPRGAPTWWTGTTTACPWIRQRPLIALALLSFTGGGLGIPPEAGILHRFLGPVFGGEQAVEGGAGIGSVAAALVSLALASAGALGAYQAYVRRPDLPGLVAARCGGWYRLPANRYWVDEVYDFLVVRPVAAMAAVLWRVVDDSIVVGAVNAVWRLIGSSAAILRRMQTGYVPTHTGLRRGWARRLKPPMPLRRTFHQRREGDPQRIAVPSVMAGGAHIVRRELLRGGRRRPGVTRLREGKEAQAAGRPPGGRPWPRR